MNKHRDKSYRTLKAKKAETGFAFEKERLFLALFLIIIMLSIALKIYKADYAGITYDESMTYLHYTNDIQSALTTYTPNNHVLNSIFIHYAHKIFGFYEHFIRVPSLLAGILFSLSIAYIIYKSIESDLLRIAALGMVSLVPFVFDYSFLARGYAFTLGGFYALIAFALWLLEHRIRFRYWLVPVIVISLLNFLIFGAMISSVLLLAAFNGTFVLLYSYRIYKDNPGKIKAIIINMVSVFLISAFLLFMLYRRIYSKILSSSTVWKWDKVWKGLPSLIEYLNNVLIKHVFHVNENFGTALLYVFASLVIIAVLFYLLRFIITFKAGTWRRYFNNDNDGNFVLIIGVVAMVIIFIYTVILKKSLGFPRNNAYLIPLVLTCCLIVLDRFGRELRNNLLSRSLQTLIVLVVAAAAIDNLPSYQRIGGMSFSGPVLRRLKVIDPEKTWNIAFSKKKRLYYMGFLYYRQFDYKFNIAKQGQFDVFICSKAERPSGAVCLDWNYFEKEHIAVVLNTALPTDKVALDVKLIEN